ncbi:MAG: serine hydrolase [Chromatiaceae bacterium]|nr:serine hydrolase [Chromatiaceae bacterium]
MSANPSRRDFLRTLTLGSAGLLLAPLSLTPLAAAQAASGGLQSRVVNHIARLRAQGLIGASDRVSWSVYDFTSRQKLVAINEDVPRQAASMIKPFVCQAWFYQASQSKRISYTPEVRKTMERMIRSSCNKSTNRLMTLVSQNAGNRGPGDVERVLKQNAPQIFQDTRIVEQIPAGGRTYRNLASAGDYGRFLEAFWRNQLPYADEMRALLSLSNRDRIVDGVDSMPDNVRVYDKTGSTAMLCGDMGIVVAPGENGGSYPYTFVAIIESPVAVKKYYGWMKQRGNAIRSVSNLVYQDLKDRYQLA